MGMFSRRFAGYLVVATGLALTLTGPFLAQSQGQEVTIRDEKQLSEWSPWPKFGWIAANLRDFSKG
jgi:hypothetical protein